MQESCGLHKRVCGCMFETLGICLNTGGISSDDRCCMNIRCCLRGDTHARNLYQKFAPMQILPKLYGLIGRLF